MYINDQLLQLPGLIMGRLGSDFDFSQVLSFFGVL